MNYELYVNHEQSDDPQRVKLRVSPNPNDDSELLERLKNTMNLNVDEFGVFELSALEAREKLDSIKQHLEVVNTLKDNIVTDNRIFVERVAKELGLSVFGDS